MPWDFGCGDIAAGIKLAHTLYQTGFVHENSAATQYRIFASDIKGLSELLRKLERSIRDAHNRYGACIFPQPGTYDPLADDFEEERRQFIGDFEATLKECEDLLKRKEKFLSKESNAADNIWYHMTPEGQVIEELRHRIHMHATKIKLVIDRLSIDLLTDVDAKVDDLVVIAERNVEISSDIRRELRVFYAQWLGVLAGHEPLTELSPVDEHFAGPSVSARFEQNLAVYAPSSLRNGIPLGEGFNALLTHYEQSIEGVDQTPEKYLSLLKTRWLLARIQSSSAYRKARPGFYYKRAISQVEKAILLRVRGTDVLTYDEQLLLELPDTAYLIWPPPPQPERRFLDPTTARANEQEIVRLQLDSGGVQEPDRVTVFRRSEDKFRVALETIAHDGRTVIENKTVHTGSDKLIPRYALPTLTSPCLEIAIISRGDEETFYRFNSSDDLFRFQTALTGYDVSHPQGNIQCQFSRDVGLDCHGSVQIWQDPIVFSSLPDSTPASSPVDLSPSDRSSHSFGVSPSRYSSVAPSMAPTNTISAVDEGWEADTIKLPALTILTQLHDKKKGIALAIMFVELAANARINPRGCKCWQSYDQCSYLCLERPKGKRIPIHVLGSDRYSDKDPDPSSFDLLPCCRRYPRSEDVITKETEYILLRFRNLEAKKRFEHELNLRFNVIDKQIEQQQEIINTFRRREDRLVSKNDPKPAANQPRQRISVARIGSIAPQIDAPDNGPSFNASFPNGSPPTPVAQHRRSSRAPINQSAGPNLAPSNGIAIPRQRTDGALATSPHAWSPPRANGDPFDASRVSPRTSTNGVPSSSDRRNTTWSSQSTSTVTKLPSNSSQQTNVTRSDNVRSSSRLHSFTKKFEGKFSRG